MRDQDYRGKVNIWWIVQWWTKINQLHFWSSFRTNSSWNELDILVGQWAGFWT